MLLRFLVATALVSIAYADKGCYDGAILSPEGDRCFHEMLYRANFSAAESFCNGYGGHLASVHNSLDNDLVEVSMKLSQFWLGARRVNGVWTWTDGSEFNYSNWVAGGPSRSFNCLLADTVTLLWGAVDCSREAYFVCETDAVEVTTTSEPQVPLNCSISTCDYRFFGETLDWNEARDYCLNLNGDLASVHENGLNDLITNWATDQSGGSIWIGGQVEPEYDVVTWSDGSDFDFSQYGDVTGTTEIFTDPTTPVWEERSTSNLECIQVVPVAQGWLNTRCTDTSAFVCEIPRVASLSIL